MPVSHIHQTNSFFVNFDLSPVGIHEQKNRRMRTEQRSSQKCDPEDLVLEEFQQWRDEVGYWIGEYSFYGSDGNANQSVDWNYPFDHYRGFITGNIKKNAYRQRNVFLYPPQDKSQCPNDVSYGNGVCGLNGNTKIFYADQSATMCPKKKEDFAGNIEGPYGDFFYTTTELVGGNSALLYQVFFKKEALKLFGIDAPENRLYQSQLTTITRSLDGSEVYRVRNAQGFDPVTGKSSSASFYRERQVSKDEFYSSLQDTLDEYNILDSDTCAWTPGDTGGSVPSGLNPGFEACKDHLEYSFVL